MPDAIWPAAYDGTFLYGDLSCGKMFKLMPIAGGGYSVSDFASGFGGYRESGFGREGGLHGLLPYLQLA